MNAEEIRQKALDAAESSDTPAELDQIRLKYLGRKGYLTQLFSEIPELPNARDRKKAGVILNAVKGEIEDALSQRESALKESERRELAAAEFDPTVPGKRVPTGTLHPLTQFRDFILEVFGRIGFEEVYAPHIESDNYNFSLLNMPPDHPGRDLWDTLYLGDQTLLRTHTSNIQVREMEKRSERLVGEGAPIKVMSFDRCFRYEAVDPRHSHTFTHFEILYIDENVSIANLKWLSDYFMRCVFGERAETRLRPKYYPFVEPGVGVDALCPFCKGKGCKICGKGWLELAGAGMVHPKVLENGGIDPSKYSGLAWGFGPERMLMIKLGIDDIRYFYEGDLRFLKQF